MSRVFWIVLDSVGMGEAFDAKDFGDEGCNTIGHILEKYPDLMIPNLRKLGYGNIEGMVNIKPINNPMGAFARLQEKSAGKDTTTGHWEMIGIHTKSAFPTYPNGFPKEVIDEFVEKCGIPGVLFNGVASGTEIINRFGDEHMATKKPIIYTSSDSVFQIACHEEVYPPEKLYEMCKIARGILNGDHDVGRVIARPFVTGDAGYVRTSNRRDFSRKPSTPNVLTYISDAGLEVYGIGKIGDIFDEVGLTKVVHTKDNEDGMDKTIAAVKEIGDGLIFTNLVEFDMTWGHRRDVDGYAKGLENFDIRLGQLITEIAMHDGDDYIIITADHGCDPTFKGTDHTREYVPLLIWGKNVKSGVDLGTRYSFADTGRTVLDILKVAGETEIGTSYLEEISYEI